VAESLDFGVIGANDGAPSTAEAPFGGRKDSGLGKEGGTHGVDAYTEFKYVSVRVR
jgi:succinate-semialdehyde dehydrogenase/glutarate-semialdehyde dehydrogenase